MAGFDFLNKNLWKKETKQFICTLSVINKNLKMLLNAATFKLIICNNSESNVFLLNVSDIFIGVMPIMKTFEETVL